MFDAIVIPAVNHMPLRLVKISDHPSAAQTKLKTLQSLVDGYVEHVRIGNVLTKPRTLFKGVAMWVNEDGIARGKSQNDRAAILYGVTVHGSGIYGDAVLTGESYDPMEGAEIAHLQGPYANIEFWDAYFKKVIATVS